MTIPFSIPDVKPLYFDTSQVDRDGFQKRLQTLLGVLHNRETRNIELQKMKREEALRLDQAAAGEQLAQMIRGMDTVPGLSIPTAGPMGGAGPTVQTKPFEGPLAQSFQPRPGTMVNFEMFKTGQNTISQYFNDRNERVKARTPAKPELPEFKTDAKDGRVYRVPKSGGTATPVYKADGTPLIGELPDKPDKPELMDVYDNVTGQIVLMPKVAGPLPPQFTKAGPMTDQEKKDAVLYTRATSAIKNALTLPPIPEDFVTTLLTAEGSGQGNQPLRTYLRKVKLDPSTRRSLLAWETVLSSGLYATSGAAITVSEVLRELSLIPTTADLKDPRLLEDKRQALLDRMRALENGGRRELQQLRLRGSKIPTMQEILAEIEAQAAAVNPDTGQPWNPKNRYAPKPNNFVERRP